MACAAAEVAFIGIGGRTAPAPLPQLLQALASVRSIRVVIHYLPTRKYLSVLIRQVCALSSLCVSPGQRLRHGERVSDVTQLFLRPVFSALVQVYAECVTIGLGATMTGLPDAPGLCLARRDCQLLLRGLFCDPPTPLCRKFLLRLVFPLLQRCLAVMKIAIVYDVI